MNADGLLPYRRYADSGAVDQAEQALKEMLALPLSRDQRMSWEWEAVWFYAFSRRNSHEARQREQIADTCDPIPTQQSQVWKARAALAALEGRTAEARDLAAKALTCAESELSDSRALLKALHDDLAEVISPSFPAARAT
jgi:hypothetical protein